MPARRTKKRTTIPERPRRQVKAAAPRGRDRSGANWAAAATAIPLCMFLLTLCRSIYWGDSTELALVADAAGVAHPTGYPLWSMAAALFARLPLPGWTPSLAANLLSALCGAAACLALFLLLREAGVARPWALFGALALASSPEMWLQAGIAEVYTLHVLLVLLVLLAACRFRAKPSSGRLYALALSAGLSLCNHMTSLLLAAPVLLLAAGSLHRPGGGGERRAAVWSRAAAIFLMGLLPYIYLPLRSLADPWPDYGNPETGEGFRWLVSGSQFSYLMFSSGVDYFTGELRDFLGQLPGRFSPWLLAVAAVGAARDWAGKRTRPLAAAFTLYATLVLAHALNYRIDDKEAYFLPVYALLAFWAGSGAGAVAKLAGDWLERRGTGRSVRRALAAAAAIVLALPLAHQAARAYHFADRSEDRSLALYTDAVFDSTEPGALVIVGDFNVYSAYLYGRLVEGRYRDFDCLLDYLFPFPWYLEQLERVSPGVSIPEAALMAARADWRARGGRLRGLEHGRRKERLLIEIKRLVIEANMASRPVYLHTRDDTTMKEEWAGIFPLDYRGLSYRVLPPGRRTAPRPYEADYPLFDRKPGASRRAPHPYQRAAYHKFSDAANRLGVILASGGLVRQAREAFDRGLAYDPDNFGIYRNRGLLRLELLGDETGGRADFRRYIDAWRASGEPATEDIAAIRRFLAGPPRTPGNGGP